MKYVALDIEASSLDAKHDPTVPLWCVACCNSDLSIISFTVLEELRGYVHDILQDTEYKFLIHNAAFDIPVLRCRGIDIPEGRYVCTRLASYLLDTDALTSLDELAKKYLGDEKQPVKEKLIELGVFEKNVKNDELFAFDYSTHTEALGVLKEYCAHDAALTMRLFKEYILPSYRKLPRVHNAFINLEMPYVECIIEMESTGLFIDLPKINELSALFISEMEEPKRNLSLVLPGELKWEPNTKSYNLVEKRNRQRELKTFPFNHNSGDHVSHRLIEEGWRPREFSKKTTKPVVDKEVLEGLQEKHPWVADVLKLREYEKLQNTFVENLKESAINNGGFVLASFNQCATITTRLSSSSPNLQNIPARSKLGKKIRECVVAPEGYTLCVADLDQIEIRVLAYYLQLWANEPRMAEAARQGLDAHQANADTWGVERQVAKKLIFSIVYGQQAAALGVGLGVSAKQAQEFLDKVNGGMPAVQHLKEMVWKGARNDGCSLYTLYGTRMFYPWLKSDQEWQRSRAERQCFNALIQGSAANINKALSIELRKKTQHLGSFIAASVHDETLVYVPTQKVEEFIAIADGVFNTDRILRNAFYVPVTGKWNKGDNWSAAKEA